MDKDTIIKIKNLLRDYPEVFFPVRNLYQNRLIGMDLPPFHKLVDELRSHPDLVVTKNIKTRDENDPVVMLRERIPTLEEIVGEIRSGIGNTLDNLSRAYNAGIDGMSPEEEDMMLEAMRRTRDLRNEMERIFAEAGQRAAEKNAPGRGRDDRD